MYLTSIKSEIGSTMSAHKFINYEQKFNLNNPYTPIEEANINMLDEIDEIDDLDDIQYIVNSHSLFM